MADTGVRTLFFKDDGIIPNNPSLPVLVYSDVFHGKADQTESIFNRHNWRNSWINGVYDYHHYHSITHEVLGVVRGHAVLHIGGEHGEKVEIREGDVLVLPSGTGHKRLNSSPDFQVAGAYPDGVNYNLRTGKEGERPQVLEEIRAVPIPETDPVYGDRGPLIEHWKKQTAGR